MRARACGFADPALNGSPGIRMTTGSEVRHSRKNSEEKLSGVRSTGVRQDDLKSTIHLGPRALRVCCGHAIEPRLAEIRDHSGPTIFVSVWRCPYCGRATS